MPIKASETEFNGHPMLVLEWDGREPDSRPFKIGLGNAKRVMAGHDHVKAFIDKHKNDPKRAFTPAPQATVGADGQREAAYRESGPGAERAGSGYRDA